MRRVAYSNALLACGGDVDMLGSDRKGRDDLDTGGQPLDGRSWQLLRQRDEKGVELRRLPDEIVGGVQVILEIEHRVVVAGGPGVDRLRQATGDEQTLLHAPNLRKAVRPWSQHCLKAVAFAPGGWPCWPI